MAGAWRGDDIAARFFSQRPRRLDRLWTGVHPAAERAAPRHIRSGASLRAQCDRDSQRPTQRQERQRTYDLCRLGHQQSHSPALGSRRAEKAQRTRARRKAPVLQTCKLLADGRARLPALSGGADLFHPDAEGSPHDGARRPHNAPRLSQCAAFGACRAILVRRIRRPLRRRYAGGRHDRDERPHLYRRVPHAPYRQAARHRTLPHDRGREERWK